MKKIRQLALILITALFILPILVSCERGESNVVTIVTTSEDFRIEHIQRRLNEQFPQYRIIINYMTTGNLGATLMAAGTAIDADIIGELEVTFLERSLDSLADLSEFDYSPFLPELVPAHRRWLPFVRGSGSIIINESFLAARGIPIPTSYQCLIRPEFRGVLSMPNPRTSGTGFFFLKSLVNAWGEDAAFEYFDRFAENVLQFTSSGAGPVNALIQGEVGIGLGLTFQAVTAINERGAPLTITHFEEGSPYMLYGMAIVRGRETRQAVRDVFAFYVDVLTREDKELFAPEQIFIEQVNNIPNYPQNVRPADMRGAESPEVRERLMARWRF